MCILPQRNRKRKVCFKEDKSFSFIMPAITFDSVSVGSHMTSDILRKGLTYTVCPACYFAVGLFPQCLFALFTLQPAWPCMDVWYPYTTRKQRLLAAPAPSTLDTLVSSRWRPPILDLPVIQRSRKFPGFCFSLVASFQLNQQMPAPNPSLNILSPSSQGSAPSR